MNKEKLIKWLKNPYTILLILLIIFSFIIRLKYFTINPALWWDEATYLNAGKFFAFGQPYWPLEMQRPPLFPLIIASIFKIGLGEVGVRFLAVLLPSLLTVFLTYLIGKKLYNKKIGLIAALAMSVCWVLLFNTTRVHADAMITFISMLTIYFFWRYTRSPKLKYAILIGILVGLGFLIKLQAILVVIFIIIYLIVTQRFRFLKDKNWYIALGIAIVAVIPYLIYNLFKWGNIFAFSYGYYDPTGIAIRAARPIAWWIFGYFHSFPQLAFFILFLIGIITFYKMFIGFDMVVKNKNKKLQADLFILLWLLIYLGYWVFINRNIEPRHFLPAVFVIFLISAKGFMFIYDMIKRFSKVIALIIIGVLLIAGVYQGLDYNSKLVEARKDTFYYVNPAGKWIAENSNEGDVIMSNNVHAELTYFSERRVWSFTATEEQMIDRIKKEKPKYLIITTYFPSEQWTFEYPSKHSDILTPVQAYFHDAEKTKPAVVVYSINL